MRKLTKIRNKQIEAQNVKNSTPKMVLPPFYTFLPLLDAISVDMRNYAVRHKKNVAYILYPGELP